MNTLTNMANNDGEITFCVKSKRERSFDEVPLDGIVIVFTGNRCVC